MDRFVRHLGPVKHLQQPFDDEHYSYIPGPSRFWLAVPFFLIAFALALAIFH